MEENKLKILEETTNKIISNLDTLINDAKTASLPKIINDINNTLLKQSSIIKNDTKKDLIKNNKGIFDKIQKQNNLLKKTGIFPTNTDSIDKIIDQWTDVNEIKKESVSLSQQSLKFYTDASTTNNFDNQTFSNLILKNKININGKLPSFADTSKIVIPGRSDESGAEMTEFMSRKITLEWGKKALDIGAEMLGIIPYVGWFLEIVATYGIEIGEAVYEMMFEMMDLVNKMGDQMQEILERIDDSYKKTIKNLGLFALDSFGSKTKADMVVNNIMGASKTMLQILNLPFSPEKIGEFQQAYSELSKTTVAFSDTDYISLSEMQSVLDLSAEDVAKISETFISMGNDVDRVANFYTSMLQSANDAGVSARSIMKNVDAFYKVSNVYRFRGGLTDLTNMVAYAKRIRLDINDIFEVMDTVADPEAAVDMAAQLQALDTAYLGLDSMDLLSASMNDVERFTKLLTDPIKDNIDTYYDAQNEKLTVRGALFSEGISQIEGVNKIFKDESLLDMMKRFAKEKKVKEELELAPGYAGLSADEIDKYVATITSQYGGGEVSLLGKKVSQLTSSDLKMLTSSGIDATAESKSILETSAQATVSVKDQAEANQLVYESVFNSTDVINQVSAALTKDELLSALKVAGQTVMDVGLKTFESEKFRKYEALIDFIGFSEQEALWFQPYFENGKQGDLIKTLLKINETVGVALKVFMSESDTKNDLTIKPKTTTKKRGGFVQAESGIAEMGKTTTMSIPTTNSVKSLGDLLSTFTTNKFGAGVSSQSNMGGDTKIIVSGVIHNKINEKDASLLSGQKVYEILEKQLTK